MLDKPQAPNEIWKGPYGRIYHGATIVYVYSPEYHGWDYEPDLPRKLLLFQYVNDQYEFSQVCEELAQATLTTGQLRPMREAISRLQALGYNPEKIVGRDLIEIVIEQVEWHASSYHDLRKLVGVT